MVRHVHHVNFIVRDMDTALPAWERIIGKPAGRRERLDARQVDVARFDVGGVWIVLVQPTGPGKPQDYLDRHGEGFFLLSFGVDSLDAEIERLGDAQFDGAARAGLDDWLVRDLDAGRIAGAQLQLLQRLNA